MTLTGVLVMLVEAVLKPNNQPQAARHPRHPWHPGSPSRPVCISFFFPAGTAFFGTVQSDAFSVFLPGNRWHRPGDAADLARLFRGPHQLCRRILRAGPVRRDRHDADDLLGRTAHGFISLEISSISTYILAGYRKRSATSSEASIKYFLLGSFRHRIFSLRHRALFWRYRLDEYL